MVVCELRVRQAGYTICLVIHVLPVGLEARCPLGKRSKQVGIELVHDLLVDAGFKLPGKEGGPRCLLQLEEKARAKNGRVEMKTRQKKKKRADYEVVACQEDREVWK